MNEDARPLAHRIPPQAVLFDMDGLLIDSEPLWAVSINEYCARRGARYSDEDATACMGRGIPYCVTYLADRYGWADEGDAHVTEITEDFLTRVGSAPERPGASSLLRSLHGRVPFALGSSSERRVIDAALSGRGWHQLFGAVVTGSDVTRLKPAPDIFLEAARRLGQRPETCVVFEDSLAGCKAARAAGMIVVAVPGEGVEREQFTESADVVALDLWVGARSVGLGVVQGH